MASVGGIGIVAASSARSGIVVHHGVHCAGGNTEKQSWGSKFFKVAQVVLPVRLRHDCHIVAFVLEYASQDSAAH